MLQAKTKEQKEFINKILSKNKEFDNEKRYNVPRWSAKVYDNVDIRILFEYEYRNGDSVWDARKENSCVYLSFDIMAEIVDYLREQDNLK